MYLIISNVDEEIIFLWCDKVRYKVSVLCKKYCLEDALNMFEFQSIKEGPKLIYFTQRMFAEKGCDLIVVTLR